jgi:Na+-driven multidrug efflux pump
MVFLCRSAGVAYNEVVIGHCGNREEIPALRLFAWVVGSIFTIILAVVALTPLSGVWFSSVMGLDLELVELGMASLWIAIPIPLLTFLQSLYQGVLVDSHRTRFITESVALFLVVTSLVIWLGVLIGPENGVVAVLMAYTIGNLIQTGWLWHRCRTAIFRGMG